MGMTDQQLFRRVELPLAVPEIIAGVRIATVSTVAIASLATFAGGGGLGGPLYFAIRQDAFKTGIFIPTIILLAMAVLLDLRPVADPEPADALALAEDHRARTRGTFIRRILSTAGAKA